MGRVDAAGEGLVDEPLLLLDVHRAVPDGGSGGGITADVVHPVAVGHDLVESVLDLVPGALILRFLLAPDDLVRGSVGRQRGLELLLRERVELLDAHDGDVIDAAGAARLEQVEVDLAAAQHHALDAFRLQVLDLRDHGLE